MRAVLGQARQLRREAGIRVCTITAALGVSKHAIQRWETGQLPRDGGAAMPYIRVVQGLARHCEIRETDPVPW